MPLWRQHSGHHLPSEALGICHPGLDPGTSRMQQRCSMRMFPFWIPNQVWDDGYREPHLDEDVHCGCNLNVIKPNSEQTQENRHLLSNRTAGERKYFKLRLFALHDCTIQQICGWTQQATFHNAKGNLSRAERLPFRRPNAAYCKALAVKTLRKRTVYSARMFMK